MTAPHPATAPLGLLGGSFDPVHEGHLQLARDALAALGLAEIAFLPAGMPWQKRTRTPAPDRARMLEIAISGEPRFRIDRREMERTGPTYTVDTLHALRGELGPGRPLVWIMGSDQLQRLDTWHRWDELFDLAHIAVARRPGAEGTLPAAVVQAVQRRHAGAADLRSRPAGMLAEFAMHPVDCSATELRRLLGEGVLPREHLAAGVLEYIHSHRLYETTHGSAKAATTRH